MMDLIFNKISEWRFHVDLELIEMFDRDRNLLQYLKPRGRMRSLWERVCWGIPLV